MSLYLSMTDEVVLLFGISDDPATRERIASDMQTALPDIAMTEFRFDPQNLHLLDGIRQSVNPDNKRPLVAVRGLESLTSEEKAEAIQGLNDQRNRWGRTGISLLILTDTATMADIANHAYDFYSWRSTAMMFDAPKPATANQPKPAF